MPAAVDARTASGEEIQAHVAPSVSPRFIGNRLLAVGLRLRVPLIRLPLTPRHRQERLLWCRERVDWREEWRSVVFSDESRFYLYESNGRTRIRRRPGERHLPECIRHDTQAPSQASWCEGPSVTTLSHLVFLLGKVNSAFYITYVVNPVLLPFLRQEDDALFQQDYALPQTAAATECVLRGCTTSQTSKIPRSLANWTRMGHDEAETYYFSRTCYNHCQIATTGAICLGQSVAE